MKTNGEAAAGGTAMDRVEAYGRALVNASAYVDDGYRPDADPLRSALDDVAEARARIVAAQITRK